MPSKPNSDLKISVITVCYNSASTIADALQSVASQTWPHVEHIVIDGASTDGTLAVVDHYREGLAKLVSEPDAGIYDAMNKGLRLATGDLIGFLNADDVFADDNVVADIARLAAFEGADMLYGDLEYVSSQPARHALRHWRSGRFHPAQLALGWMPPHPTFYFRRSLLEKIGGFNVRYKIAADYDFMLRYLRVSGQKTAYLPRVLVKMTAGGASNRSIAAIFRKSYEDYSILRKNGVGGLVTLVCKNVRKLPQLIPYFSRYLDKEQK